MEVPVPFPEGREEASGRPFLTAHEMRLDFGSAGHTHTAVLVAEVWDGEAPRAEGPWEAEGEAELSSLTGRLSVEVVAGSESEAIVLGAEDARWRVRAYCSGRAEVARLAAVGVPHGVERYLVRFWQIA